MWNAMVVEGKVSFVCILVFERVYCFYVDIWIDTMAWESKPVCKSLDEKYFKNQE